MEYFKDKLKHWIKDGVDNDAIAQAKALGHHLAEDIKDEKGKITSEKLTSTQIMKFLGKLKRIKIAIAGKNGGFDAEKQTIKLLEPQLAYAVGKKKGKGKIKVFYDEIAPAFSQIDYELQFKNFVNLMEAVVAFHKEKESQSEKNKTN